jgi:glycosyltransferase involved in cell wall biosynthesis
MKIYVGSPVYRGAEVEHQESMFALIELVRRDPDIQMQRATIKGDADIGRARNVAATNFLEQSDADIFLTIDDDIWFSPEDALTLCKKCYNGYNVIGGLYMTRGILNVQPAILLADNEAFTFQPDEKPLKAQFLSTGFMAMHRKVFEKMTKHPEVRYCMKTSKTPFYTFYLQKTIPWPNDENLYLSEDWAFCQRAREMGFDIWLDPTIRLGHIGKYIYRLEDLLEAHIKPCPVRLTRDPEGHLTAEALIEPGDEGLLPDYRGRGMEATLANKRK